MKLKQGGLLRTGQVAGFVTLLSLAACGGGGGGGSVVGGGGDTGAPATVSVAGVASKGLLSGALVSAYSVNTDGSRGALIKSVVTSADGSYTVAGLRPGVMVLLEVTAHPDGHTTMMDEASGQTVTLPASSDFKIRAATSLETAGTTTAQITPYSEMAVTLAQSNGGIKADVVATANATVSSFAGVSILTERPTFDNTGKATNAAAVKLAAVSELAKAGVSDDESSCAATGDAPSAEAVLASVSCVVNYLSTKGTTTAVTAALNTAQTAAKANANITEPTELAKVDVPLSDQPTTLTVLPSAHRSAIQEAKSLIQSVRNTAAALSNKEGSDSLASRLSAMATASHGVAGPIDESTLTWVSSIEDAIRISRVASNPSFQLPYSPQPYVRMWYWGGPYFVEPTFSSANPSLWTAIRLKSGSACRFTTDATYATAATGPTDYVGCQVLRRFVYKGWTSTPQFAVMHHFGLTKLNADSYSVKSALVKVNIDPEAPGSIGVVTTLEGSSTLDTHEATVSREGAAPNYTGVTITGDLAPGVREPDNWLAEAPVSLGTRQAVNLSVSSVAVDSTTTRVNLQGGVSVYDGSAVQSRISLLAGSYLQAKTAVGGNISAPSDVDLSAHRMHLVLEGQLKDGYKVGGTLDVSDFVHTDTRWGPTKGSFAGYFTDMTGTAKLFDGLLTLDMPTDSGLNWLANFDGTLVTTGANTLNVNLTAHVSPSVLGDFTASGRYTQGGNSFLVTALANKAAPADNTLTFQTLSGVGFTFKRDDTMVLIKKGDTEVGTFNVGNSRLTYLDHTYEQY